MKTRILFSITKRYYFLISGNNGKDISVLLPKQFIRKQTTKNEFQVLNTNIPKNIYNCVRVPQDKKKNPQRFQNSHRKLSIGNEYIKQKIHKIFYVFIGTGALSRVGRKSLTLTLKFCTTYFLWVQTVCDSSMFVEQRYVTPYLITHM